MMNWKLKFARPKVRLSFHPVDIDSFKSQIRGQENRFDEALLLTWQSTASNVIRKGCIRSLYLAANIINYTNPSFRLHICGLPGLGTKLITEKAKELNIDKSVIMHGEISEDTKMKMMKELRYYFCLSYYEGFGVAALEAVASQMIVLHTNTGGLQDSVSDLGVNIEDFDKTYNRYDNRDSSLIKEQTVELYKRIMCFSINESKLRSHLSQFTYESRSTQILSCYE
jgi:glycosyltransferase involved in cell wall biosynthesis